MKKEFRASGSKNITMLSMATRLSSIPIGSTDITEPQSLLGKQSRNSNIICLQALALLLQGERVEVALAIARAVTARHWSLMAYSQSDHNFLCRNPSLLFLACFLDRLNAMTYDFGGWSWNNLAGCQCSGKEVFIYSFADMGIGSVEDSECED